MSEPGPQHPLTYRQEIAAPIFDLLRAGESAAVVGPASMGKSRLLHFLRRPDVQAHYLGEAAANTQLVLVDCNRLAGVTEWGLYELLLTALTEATAEPPLRESFNDLRREVITRRNGLLARRHVELAAHMLCAEQGRRLCLVFDEFDEAYRNLPPAALANLRALRDAHRYRLCYLLNLRDHPARLRLPDDNEGFYELASRSVLGLKPYGEADARRVVAQLAARRSRPVAEYEQADLLRLSGGHPGLIVALFDLLLHAPNGFPAQDAAEWALAQPQVGEECRKLWCGLAQDEQLALSRLAQGIGAPHHVRDLLALKGLIRPLGRDEAAFFSPLFLAYVLAHGSVGEQALWLDEAAAVAWVEGRPVTDLSPLEFDLLRYLHRRRGEVCTREQIIAVLYPDEAIGADGAADNRVDSLMRHLRKAVEPAPDHPRYLLTVRGHGYKLVDRPE